MKSNQKLKQEARLKNDNETRNYLVLGGQIISGQYFRFKDAYLKAKKQKNITTASIRAENNREKFAGA